MNRQRQCNTQATQHQRGAVAIIVALCLTLLVGMLGLVLDLGHLYVAKTELQNAADAAALSGAKQLDGTTARICCGVDSAQARAIETARRNKYDLNAKVVTLTAVNLWVGSCPEDSCMVPISSVNSDALAANKTFLKVDTRPGTGTDTGIQHLNTWFIQVLSAATTTTQTFGMAVAGNYAVDITPIGICQLPDPGTVHELGYERGVSYKVSDANPIGPGTMYWVDTVSNTPGVCKTTNTNETLPNICTGKVSYTPVVGQTVNTNTGISTPQLRALDSRFGDYPRSAGCNPATAPPDTNVKEYLCTNVKGDKGCLKDTNTTTGLTGLPRSWMTTNPNKQSILFGTFDGVYKPKPYTAPRLIGDYGVLWSAYRPKDATVAAAYPPPLNSYPGSSPYAQTASSPFPYYNYFQAPPVAYSPGVEGRRVLNMIIIDCSTAGGVCRPAKVLGVGKFFMQRRAMQPLPAEVHVEFGGLLSTPFPRGDIKLYK